MAVYCFIIIVTCLFVLFRVAPAAYESSQARSLIGATAAGLHHNHSNARSKPCLQTTSQLMATPDPKPTERGQGLNPQPHHSQLDSFLLCHNRNSWDGIFFIFAISLGHSCGIWRFPGQGSNRSYSCWPVPQPQQHEILAVSSTYTTAQGNVGSLTH